MTKCEKCIHGDICANRDCMDSDDEIAMTYCAHFIGKADFVEVVRCKDCEYYIPDADLNHNEYPNDLEADGFCDNSLRYSDEMCFCSYGKKVQSNEQV